ncbi:MAG: hypothetical protein U0W24_12720 [Bacteroidales bacterium]
MDIQAQKELIIEQFRLVDDIDLINAIKNLLDYALKKQSEIYQIPEEQQQLVMERYEKIRKNPERLLDWNESKKKLKH